MSRNNNINKNNTKDNTKDTTKIKYKDNAYRQAAWRKPMQLLMLTVLALCWLSIGLYYLASEPKDYSAAERRKLAAAPSLTYSSIKNGSYLPSLEDYLKDQFPARENFRSVKTASSLYGFLRLQDNGYAIRDGHLGRMDMALNESSVAYACTQMRSLYDIYLADSGCRVYYCIIPDKNYYLQLSNPSYPTLDYGAMDMQIQGLLDFATPIDIRNDLSLSSFYLTDTHWKQESLLPAAETILSAMSAKDGVFPSAKELNPTEEIPPAGEYHVETALERFHGVLCGNMGWYAPSEPMRYLTSERTLSAEVSHLENRDCVTVYDPYYLTYDGPGADPYSFFLSGSSAFITIKNMSYGQSGELIVFRDSFGSSIAPLFLTGYDQITLIDTRYINPSLLGDYIEFKDQDVLFLYSTLLINNSYTMKEPL